MKHLRKSLAAVLALLLAFGVGAAAAEAEISEEPDVPYVLYVQGYPPLTEGSGFTLRISVELYIPEGWTVEYQWQERKNTGDADIPGATERTLTLSPGDTGYPQRPAGSKRWWDYWYSYQCLITARDEKGTVLALEGYSSGMIEPSAFWKAFRAVAGAFENVLRVIFFPIWVPLALLIVIIMHLK